MANTTEELTVGLTAATHDSDKIKKNERHLIRMVDPKQSTAASCARALAAGTKFLTRQRASAASTAATVASPFIAGSVHVTLEGHTLRSSLVAFSQSKVRNKECGRFKTIHIKVGPGQNDVIKANTVWSKSVGSLFIYNIGPYGQTEKRTSVLKVLNEIYHGSSCKIALQKKLFTKIEEKVKIGSTITLEDLYSINPDIRKLDEIEVIARLHRLQAMIYLVTNLEITRRPLYADSVGYKQEKLGKQQQTVLCAEMMLDAWSKVFKLLQHGSLTSKQVFAQDAEYGLPTTKYLRKVEDAKLLRKIAKIDALYVQVFYPAAAAVAAEMGCVAIPSMEEAHQRFISCTTSKQESPGKRYVTPEKPLQVLEKTADDADELFILRRRCEFDELEKENLPAMPAMLTSSAKNKGSKRTAVAESTCQVTVLAQHVAERVVRRRITADERPASLLFSASAPLPAKQAVAIALARPQELLGTEQKPFTRAMAKAIKP